MAPSALPIHPNPASLVFAARPNSFLLPIAYCQLLGQGGRAARTRVEAGFTMKRVTEVLWPIIGLGAVAFSSWLLFRELSDLSLADVAAASPVVRHGLQ